MEKYREQTDENSCWNKAHDDEPIFVLRAKDVAAVDTIRAWIALRIAHGKNTIDDDKIQDCIKLCERMQSWQERGKHPMSDETFVRRCNELKDAKLPWPVARFYLWSEGAGSYETIERRLRELDPFGVANAMAEASSQG